MLPAAPKFSGCLERLQPPPPQCLYVCLSGLTVSLCGPPPPPSLPNQSTLAEDRTMSLPLKGGVKPEGYAWDGSRLPAKEAGRGESPPAPWMPTLLPPPLPGHLGRMLPCSAAISLPNWRNAPLSLLQFRSACSRADDNGDGAYGPQSHRAFWESDTGTQAWREGPWALEHSFSLCSSQGHRSPLLSLLKRSQCGKNSLSRQRLRRAGVGRAHIQGGHVGAKIESHLASPASAPPPTA